MAIQQTCPPTQIPRIQRERKYPDGAIVIASSKLVMKVIDATDCLAGWRYQLGFIRADGKLDKRRRRSTRYFFENMLELAPVCRPVFFTSWSVRQILDGHKPKTRRIMSPQPTAQWYDDVVIGGQLKEHGHYEYEYPTGSKQFPGEMFWADGDSDQWAKYCPLGRPGDILWVREPFRSMAKGIDYKADYEHRIGFRWQSNIYMKKQDCRLWLRIKSVRVEQLQDITETDAIAEGIEPVDLFSAQAGYKSYEVIHRGRHKGTAHPHSAVPNKSAITSYKELWEAMHGAKAWEENPWVWVIEYEPCDKPINFLP